jgi:ABC-type branched-subunit amino acid transport system substrate-binding protein
VRRVYASLPLRGPAARLGRDLLRGAQLAHERTGAEVELVVLDSFGEDREDQAAANARLAAGDRDALAYLGDFHSRQVLESASSVRQVCWRWRRWRRSQHSADRPSSG